MGLLQKTFRLWWQKPANVNERNEKREISFLELFYDLAYVVIIIELTHVVIEHLSVVTLIEYAGLFAMVWFAWVNGSFYHELHGNNDIRTRIFTFLQMFTLAGMGIFVHNAFGEGYQGFALSYSAFLAILTVLWWRSGVHDAVHRPMSRPYVAGFCVTTATFILSAFLEPPVTYYLWFGGISFAMLLPIVLMPRQRGIDPVHRENAQRISPSIVERFGLLTIIMLGEIIISIVRGSTHVKYFTPEIILTIFFSLAIVMALWWVYFDFAARRLPVQTVSYRMSWMYLHLPLLMSIGLISAGILNVLEHPEHLTEFGRWLLVGPVAAFLVLVSLLFRTLDLNPDNREFHDLATTVSLLSAMLIILVGIFHLPTVTTIGLVALLLFAPVFAAFRLWVRRRHERAVREGEYSGS